MGEALAIEDDPILFSPSQLVSSTKLSKSLGAYLERALAQPLFVTRAGEPEAVLLSIDAYRELIREEHRAEEMHQLVLAIRRLVEALKSDTPTMGFDEVMSRFGVTDADLQKADDDELLDD